MVSSCRPFLPVALFALLVTPTAGRAQVTFTNPTPIVIPTQGSANPYPSAITVAGYTGTVTGITVTLTGYTHTFTDDVAALVVGPTGARAVLFNGAGVAGGSGNAATNFTLTFSDTAAAPLPDNAAFTAGTYRPGQNEFPGDSLPAPAPAGPYATTFAGFTGTDPSGTYSLYVADFNAGDGGSIASWSVTIEGIAPVPEPGAVLGAAALGLAAAGWARRLAAR